MDTLTSVSHFKKSTETELLTFLTRQASLNNFPFALWKLPSKPLKNLVISNAYQKLGEQLEIEEQSPGFIFAPFSRKKDKIFLPADYLFRFEDDRLKDPQSPLEINSLTWLEKHYSENFKVGLKLTSIDEASKSLISPANYIDLVKLCIEEISKGTFEKVVPSRTKHITLSEDFDVVSSFEKLCQRYPDALVSFVHIPAIGSWLGATPEMLVSVEDKKIFRTVALAATQPYLDGVNLKSVAWTQKDIEEQALVERYIISCFKKIRLREYDEQGPRTSVAGNLMHLKSDFSVNMISANFPQLGSVMLDLLHPTSAVCGMPLDVSLDFINRTEGYDRSFYSGYLGPVNIDNNINIFVNLRCMQLFSNKAILYAGAGVTIDSVPEQELEETEIKFKTLLNVIL
jgi:isochorismate synthase